MISPTIAASCGLIPRNPGPRLRLGFTPGEWLWRHKILVERNGRNDFERSKVRLSKCNELA